MVIKSMSRSSQTFSQLVKYFNKENTIHQYTWNMYSDAQSQEQIIEEFLDNARYLKDSRGKVYMYHEILSLERNNASDFWTIFCATG